MKKIFFLLICLYSFSFSDYDVEYNGEVFSGYDHYREAKRPCSMGVGYVITYDPQNLYTYVTNITYRGSPDSDNYCMTYYYQFEGSFKYLIPHCSSDEVRLDNYCYAVNSVNDDICPNQFIISTSDVDSLGNHLGVCSPCADISSVVASRTPNGWVSFLNVYNSELDCAKKAQDEYIGRYVFQTYQKGSCTYNICYIDTYNTNSCEDAQNYSDLIEPGYIMKGIVNNEESCRSFVDSVNYLNYYVKRVYPDCESDKSLYCFLKPSLNNPDNGVPLPDNNVTNPDGTIKLDSNNSSVPELNVTNNNQYDLNSTMQTNNLLTSLAMDMKRFINKYNEDDEYWRKENDKKFKERTENDNANANKMLSKFSSVSDTLSSKLSSLNVDIESKLDTLNDTIEDKNLSVDIDLNPINENLNDIKKEINVTNNLLSGVFGESNYSTPDINTSAGSLSQYLPSDSWFDDNKIDLSISYDGDCYLQTFTWTDSTGTHVFPPVDFVDDLPLEKISKLLMALLFVIGLKDFLKD